MSKIEEAIEDIMDRHFGGMDFSDIITTEVSQTWDMDDLDRIDDIADAVESLENNLDTSTLNSLRKDIDKLKIDVENFQLSEQYLQCAWKTLSDNLKDDLEALRNEKSFFQKLIQKLMFWRYR
jgi:Na+/phosphate symporter